MVYVAREMERRGMTLPLLIGGATTSRQHTAVKIAPEYRGADRARARRVARRRRGVEPAERRRSGRRSTRRTARTQAELREQHAHAQRAAAAVATTRRARTGCSVDWARERLPAPSFIGRRVLDDVPLAELVPYIDWTFFFTAWELKGRFPAILDHPEYGPAARELYEHAQRAARRASSTDELLTRARRLRLLAGRQPTATTSCCLHGRSATQRPKLARFPMLRQQELIADEQAEPVARRLRRAARQRRRRLPRRVRRDRRPRRRRAGAAASRPTHDDYHAIMVKALADRLAEAFAEYLHAQARRDWGYGAAETLVQRRLIDEKYRGIRPAFGYPACPDHSEKRTLFELLDAPAHRHRR